MKNLIFFGSDRYSALVLERFLTSNVCNVSTVITTPPKPVGRGGDLTPNIVNKVAKEQKIKVMYYPDNKEDLNNFILNLPIDLNTVGITASFPRLLPPTLIEKFGGKLYNIHPSLLPQYRNVAPVPYAIAMGDDITGVSIFEIGNGIDNGQIVAQADHLILPTDTTPFLLNKLFTLGTNLFLQFLTTPNDPSLTSGIRVMRSAELIFTRKLSRESGFIEWPCIQKLVDNKPITTTDTKNPLINLRLTHHPDRTHNILLDLIRGLEGYEKIWTIAATSKGELEIKILYSLHDSQYSVLIAGKPKPIPWSDFEKYYIV